MLRRFLSNRTHEKAENHKMMQFYETYKGNEIVSTLLSQIGWSNNLTIFSRTKTM